jgi:cyclopropane fatty-acyl-phospholipid synthase-like methyltransferase
MDEEHLDVASLVEAGYDRMAEQYLSTKDAEDATTLTALEDLAGRLPQGSTVLDLGCGAGVPVTQWLARRFTVTGVDVSERQIQLARENVPGATLIRASMTAVEFPSEAFDAVVAFHSIIHIPRTEQPMLVRRIHGWLRPGGAFLATWAVQAWEGAEENWEGWGAQMWWSHYDQETNLRMLQEAGFRIETAETRSSGGETWLWVIART